MSPQFSPSANKLDPFTDLRKLVESLPPLDNFPDSQRGYPGPIPSLPPLAGSQIGQKKSDCKEEKDTFQQGLCHPYHAFPWLYGAFGQIPDEEIAIELTFFAGAEPRPLSLPLQMITGPRAVTEEIARLRDGETASYQIANKYGFGLSCREMNLDFVPGDGREESCLSPTQCAHAISYGMMAVNGTRQILCLGLLGRAPIAAGLRLAAWLDQKAFSDAMTGTNILSVHSQEDNQFLEKWLSPCPDITDPFLALAHLAGEEMAALAGAICAARLAKTPVLLDGAAAVTVAALLHKISPDLTSLVQVSCYGSLHKGLNYHSWLQFLAKPLPPGVDALLCGHMVQDILALPVNHQP